MAGALAVKELNSSVNKVKTYVGSDGKLHFVNASGADTALNFKGGNAIIENLDNCVYMEESWQDARSATAAGVSVPMPANITEALFFCVASGNEHDPETAKIKSGTGKISVIKNGGGNQFAYGLTLGFYKYTNKSNPTDTVVYFNVTGNWPNMAIYYYVL